MERRRGLEPREREDGRRKVDLAHRRIDLRGGFAGRRDEKRDADGWFVDGFAVRADVRAPRRLAMPTGVNASFVTARRAGLPRRVSRGKMVCSIERSPRRGGPRRPRNPRLERAAYPWA